MMEMDDGDGWWRWMVEMDESIGSIPPLKVDRRLA
jgi:hypothetical protein